MPFSSTRRDEWHIGWRIHGWARLGAWLVVIYALHLPWDSLGGIVGERLRWMEAFTLAGLFQVGWVIGSFSGEAHVRARTTTFWPSLGAPLLVAMIVLAVFEFRAEPFRGLVAFSALLSYCAGVDVRKTAWPQMHGRPPLE